MEILKRLWKNASSKRLASVENNVYNNTEFPSLIFPWSRRMSWEPRKRVDQARPVLWVRYSIPAEYEPPVLCLLPVEVPREADRKPDNIDGIVGLLW